MLSSCSRLPRYYRARHLFFSTSSCYRGYIIDSTRVIPEGSQPKSNRELAELKDVDIEKWANAQIKGELTTPDNDGIQSLGAGGKAITTSKRPRKSKKSKSKLLSNSSMPILSPLPASLPPDTDPGRRIASLIKNHEVVSTYTQGLGWTKPKQRSYGHAKRLALSKVLWRLLRGVNTEGKAWPDRREGIRIRSDGFVNAQDVLAHPLLAEVNFMDIEDVVRKDSQKRFTVKFEVHGRDGGFSGWWIRGNAKESHASTQEVENELHLERVSSTERMSVAVHATTEEAWSSIVKHGISRMSNRYIHFFPGFTGRDNKVLNEHSCRVLVHIDLEKALSGGIKFYLASNGIILSPGNELGFLEQKYFRRVEKVAKTVSTLSEWNRGSNVGLGTHSQTEMMN